MFKRARSDGANGEEVIDLSERLAPYEKTDLCVETQERCATVDTEAAQGSRGNGLLTPRHLAR